MKTRTPRAQTVTGIRSLALIAFMLIPAFASSQSTDAGSAAPTKGSTAANAREARTATQHVDKAVDVVRRMEAEPGMAQLLSQAKGVFIVPKYGRGAFIVGASGGPGVLLVKHEGKWSDPAFYTFGGLSAGAQAGLETGSLALVLNNDKAVNSFMQDNKFSIDANAGLTIVNWSKQAERDAGRGDVVVWAESKGAFGGVAVALNDIRFDRKETSGYYQRDVAMKDVLEGKVTNPRSDALKQALAGTSSPSSGSSGAEGSSGAGTESKK
jgi:lipid-binding SYLF domain-containing protein